MSACKKILLLVNGASGTGTAKTQIYDIIEYLALRNCEVTVFPILPKKGLTSEALLRKYGRDFDTVMCCGGDGTLNHVIQGIMDAGLTEITIGYLPGGSTNDFAKSLGLSPDPAVICKAVAGNHVFAYDIGRFQDRYFNYIAAFGAFTKVSYSTDQNVKNVLGHAAYVLEGISTLQESMSMRCHLRVRHDGTVTEGDFLFGGVSNATTVGGVSSPLLQQASLDDGLFEVILISAPENLADLREIIASLASNRTDNRFVRLFRTDHLEIESPQKVSWTLDGEYGGDHSSVEISLCPKAARILVP